MQNLTQPVLINQDSLIPIINDYYRYLNQQASIIKGLCTGLVLNHCVTKFNGKPDEHIKLIQQIASEKLQGIIQSKKLQDLCDRVVLLHDRNKTPYFDIVKSLQKYIEKADTTLYSSFHLTGSFSFNYATQSIDELEKFYGLITSIAPDVEKYLFLHLGDHILGVDINAKDKLFTIYETGIDNIVKPLSFANKYYNNFSVVINTLLRLSNWKPFSLGINVITDKDISKEIAKCEALQKLREKVLNTNLNQKGYNFFTPFMIAIRHHFFDDAEKIVENKGDPDLVHGESWAAIHDATMIGDTAAIELLWKLKANLNLKGLRGITPLWLAGSYGRPRAAALLLDKQADATIKDNQNILPAQIAQAYEQEPKNYAIDQPDLLIRYDEFCETAKLLNDAVK